MFSAFAMALVMEGLLCRFVPGVGAAIILPRRRLQRFVREHAKWRDDVFFEVFVLVVAPDHDKIGSKLVQHAPGVAKPGYQRFAMMPSCRQSDIVPVFLAHRRRPTRWVPQRFRDRGIFKGALQDAA